MNRITLAGAALVALAAAPAHAADTHLPVPGQGWEVRIDAPAFQKKRETDNPGQYMFGGNGGRFNISFFVETPSCAAGLTNDALFECYKDALRRNPMVVPATVRTSSMAKGMSVMYMMQADWQGRKVSLFNVNVLFAHRGKQGDLHVSYTQPEAADIEAMINLAQSFDIVDTDGAPAPPASASTN